MTTERHMPWPDHDHDSHGECRIRPLGLFGVADITLHGVPCNNCVLDVDAVLTGPDDLVGLLNALHQVEDLLAAGRAEADCVGHDHPADARRG